MQNFRPFFIIPCILIAACNGKTNTDNSGISFIDTTKPFKREIPTYSNGKFDLFYILDKTKQKQLALDSLEYGFDNLQIRIWYDFSLVKQRRLVVITNRNSQWIATVYNMQVDWDGQTETILSKDVKQVMPKSGWESFSKKLLDLKIITLPNEQELPNYGFGGEDGSTFNVEIGTKNQYRFYSYWEPEESQDKFWQAKNLVDILKLFKEELGVSDTWLVKSSK